MHTSPPPRQHDADADADDAFTPETEIPLAFSAFKPFKEPLPPSRPPAPPPILTSDDAFQLFTLTSPQSNSPTLICTPVHRRRNTTIFSPKSTNIHPTPSSPSYRTSCLTQPRIRPLSRTSSFATLAPLPSSRSAHRTPIDHERTLKRSADSMTRLLISDDTENTNSSDSDAPPKPASHSKRRRDAKSCQRRASRRHRLPRSPSYLKAQPRELVPSSPCPSFGHSLMLKPSNLSLRSPLARSLPRRGRVDSQSSSSSTESSRTTDRFPKKNEWNRCSLSRAPDSEDEESPGKFAGSIASSTHYRSNTPILDVDNSDLVTPQMHPTPASKWPPHPESPSREDVDRFIIQALTTSATGGCQDKRMPHTPVKRQPFLMQSARRPWMSVGRLNTETIQNLDGGLFGKARKSMPNALPSFTTFATPFRRHPTVITRNDITHPEMSPTDSRRVQTPTTPAFQPQLLQRFDSGSSFGSDGSFYGTPTRPKGHPYYQRGEKGQSGTHIADSPSPSPTKSGRLEKEFEVLDEIGTGQFGDVIKVRSKAGCAAPKSPGTEYALKRTQRFEGQKSRARLMEESSILKKLCSEVAHRNVAKYIDNWEEDSMLFILTELYPLGNLAHFLSEYGTRFERLEEVRCWKILADLSSGLGFIHAAQVIHLDIKPENVFLAIDGRFVIGDFGLATEWPRESSGFEREGDKQYLAAEVLQGVYGKPADIFSLGVTMLEVAANIILPDMGEPWHSLRRNDFSAVELPRESWRLFEVIKQMMHSDPYQRPAIELISGSWPVRRAREWMATRREELISEGCVGPELFAASPLAGEEDGVLEMFLEGVESDSD